MLYGKEVRMVERTLQKLIIIPKMISLQEHSLMRDQKVTVRRFMIRKKINGLCHY